MHELSISNAIAAVVLDHIGDHRAGSVQVRAGALQMRARTLQMRAGTPCAGAR